MWPAATSEVFRDLGSLALSIHTRQTSDFSEEIGGRCGDSRYSRANPGAYTKGLAMAL